MSYSFLIMAKDDNIDDGYTAYSMEEVRPEHQVAVALLSAAAMEVESDEQGTVSIDGVGTWESYGQVGPAIILENWR